MTVSMALISANVEVIVIGGISMASAVAVTHNRVL